MKSTLAALLLAMLALGTTAGLLVGLSQSPVVGVVLPLLFSLLGGAGGFFVLKTDFSERGPRQSLLVYSLCVMAIAIGTGTGVFAGMSQKSGPTSWSLIGIGDADFVPKEARNQDALDWVLLDARLHLLGLSRGQRLLLMGRINEGTASTEKIDLEGELANLGEALQAALPEEGVVENRAEWIDVLNSTRLMQKLASSLLDDAPSTAAELALEELRAKVGLLEDDADDREYIAAMPEASQAVVAYKGAVMRMEAAVLGSRSPVIEMNTQLRLFLQEHAGALGAFRPQGISWTLAGVEQAGGTQAGDTVDS